MIHNFVGRSPRKPHQHAVAHLRSLGGDAGGASHYIPAYLGISRHISDPFFLFAGIASAGWEIAPPTERLCFGQPVVGLVELDGAPLDRELCDLTGEVLGDALLQFQPGEVGAQGLVVEVQGLTEAASRHVVPQGWVQLREAVRQLGTVDDPVGNAGQ